MEIGKLEFSIDSSAITKAADEVERLVFALEELGKLTKASDMRIEVMVGENDWMSKLVKQVNKDIYDAGMNMVRGNK